MEHFLFPPALPFTLHLAPDRERDRWMAEIDLDPNSRAKVAVCSLHFRDGFPSQENPFPTELLGEAAPPDGPTFRGRVPQLGGSFQLGEWGSMEARRYAKLMLDIVMERVEVGIEAIEAEKEEELQLEREKEEKRRREIAAFRHFNYVKLSSLKKRSRKKRKVSKFRTKKIFKASSKCPVLFKTRPSGRLRCRYCPAEFGFTKALFHHVKTSCPVIQPLLQKKVREKVEVTEEERLEALTYLYPDNKVKQLDSKKKYVCAVCKSVCDLYGLFIHMKTIHHGLLCQYCLKLFKKVRDLENHLATSHRVVTRYYSDRQQLTEISGTDFSLACGDCSALLSVEQLETHVCCTRHTTSFSCICCNLPHCSKPDLESHLAGMQCRTLQAHNSSRLTGTARDREVLRFVLTGREDPDQMETQHLLKPSSALLSLESERGRTVVRQSGHSAKKKQSLVHHFSNSDRNVLTRFGSGEEDRCLGENESSLGSVLKELPRSGVVFSGVKSRGINNHVKKEFKDLGLRLDLRSAVSGQEESLVIHQDNLLLNIEKAGKNFILKSPQSEKEEILSVEVPVLTPSRVSRRLAGEIVEDLPVKEKEKEKVVRPKPESKFERIANLQAQIDSGLARLREMVDCNTDCLLCQQCKTVWVEATFLLTHMITVHQGGEFEESLIAAIKKYHKETRGKEVIFRYFESYLDLSKYIASEPEEKVLMCNICQNMFLNYGSLISHVCSGPITAPARARFACKMCLRMDLSSFLEFQQHIRSCHHTCEICFQSFPDQRSLYHHLTSTSCGQQDLMCMKCFLTFESAESFRKHLHLKHAAEAIPCGSCWAPTWPHVYHFCLPDLPVTCPVCEVVLPNSGAYRVHHRKHTGATPHVCSVCSKGFISKSLLWKHTARRHPDHSQLARERLKERRLKRDTVKFGAVDRESVEISHDLLDDIVSEVFSELEAKQVQEEREKEKEAAAESVQALDDQKEEELLATPPKAESALDAAIMSILPQEDKVEAGPGRLEAVEASLAGRTYTEDNSWQAGLDALLAGAETDKSPSPQSKSSQEPQEPVIGGLWNQDLMFIGSKENSKPRGGARVRVPSQPGGSGGGLRTLGPADVSSSPTQDPVPGIKSLTDPEPATPVLTTTQWDLDLSEDSDEEFGPKEKRTPAMKARTVLAPRPLLDHDYCYHAFMISQQPLQPPVPEPQELSEMDKILSNVAFGGFGDLDNAMEVKEKDRDKKKKKKKKKKKRKKEIPQPKLHSSSETESDNEESSQAVDMFGIQARHNKSRSKNRVRDLTDSAKRGPKPKYHTPDAVKAKGVMAGTARPSFDTDSSHGSDSDGGAELSILKTVEISDTEISTSDFDTDFSIEEVETPRIISQPLTMPSKPSAKAKIKSPTKSPKPALKLKIKLPPQPDRLKPPTPVVKTKSSKKRKRSSLGLLEDSSKPMSKKMRESLALNGGGLRLSGSEEDHSLKPFSSLASPKKTYCFCKAPHDEVS